MMFSNSMMRSAVCYFARALVLSGLGSCVVLGCAAIVLAQPASGHPDEASVMLPERTFFSHGSYSAFAFTFAAVGRFDLEMSRDYGAQWTLDPSRFPRGAELEWKVPVGLLPSVFGVWGYHHIDYGNYDASLQKEPVTPRTACNLSDFKMTFDVEWSGSRRFNLLSEFWLTRTGSRTESNSIRALWEIGFLLHAADLAFHSKGRPIGRGHLDGARTYTVRRTGTYITFAPDHDITSGTVDFRAALSYLRAEGVIDGSEWVNGVAFGVEPTQSEEVADQSGRLLVRDLQVSFDGGADLECRR